MYFVGQKTLSEMGRHLWIALLNKKTQGEMGRHLWIALLHSITSFCNVFASDALEMPNLSWSGSYLREKNHLDTLCQN